MKKLNFTNTHIFNQGLQSNDLVLYYGVNNMTFGLSYRLAAKEYDLLSSIESPFETHPNQAIAYAENKYLVCVPGEWMSDAEMTESLSSWLRFANEKGLKKVILNGARNSEKKTISGSIEGQVEMDNERVRLIVEFVREWLEKNPDSCIEEVNFTAVSNNFTRS